MEIILVDKEFKRIGLIDNASVIWTTRYYKCGDFELYLPADENKLSLLREARYVVRNDEDYNIGIIENLEITNTPEDGDMVTVTGRLGAMLLGQRVIDKQTQLYGNVQDNIRNLIITNVINPTNEARKIDYVTLGSLDENITEKINMQTTGDNLLIKIEEICESFGLGFRMVYIKNDNTISFEMYKGIDRSYDQTGNARVIFSDEYGNLNQSKYTMTSSEIRNIAIVAGEGEGLDRKIIRVWNTKEEPIGDQRYEIWVDQRDISSNNGDLTEQEVEEQMQVSGLENLTLVSEVFEGGVILKNYKFGRPGWNDSNIFLGDIVTIHKKKWNVYINVRIIEVIESEDVEGKKITLTFGDI